MSDLRFHVLPQAPAALAPYSHAVEAAGFLFVTGQLATDRDPKQEVPEGVEAQTHKAIANLRAILQELGCSLSDVVAARVFLTNFKRDYAAMNAVYAQYFPAGRYPARTCVGVTALARDCLVEIDFIVRRP